jgi:hypothetical protein
MVTLRKKAVPEGENGRLPREGGGGRLNLSRKHTVRSPNKACAGSQTAGAQTVKSLTLLSPASKVNFQTPSWQWDGPQAGRRAGEGRRRAEVAGVGTDRVSTLSKEGSSETSTRCTKYLAFSPLNVLELKRLVFGDVQNRAPVSSIL